MMDDMKKNELNEQELNQVAGGGIIQDVKDLVEIAETVGEKVSAFITDDPDIITHGHGVSGGW